MPQGIAPLILNEAIVDGVLDSFVKLPENCNTKLLWGQENWNIFWFEWIKNSIVASQGLRFIQNLFVKLLDDLMWNYYCEVNKTEFFINVSE